MHRIIKPLALALAFAPTLAFAQAASMSDGAVPGGSSGQIQYNSAGAFAGTAFATLSTANSGTLTLGNGTQATGLIQLGNTFQSGITISGVTAVITSISSGLNKSQMDGAGLHIASNLNVDWNNGTNLASGGPDTNLSRDAAGVVDAGTGAAGSSAGAIKASAYLPGGAAPTLSGTCTTSTQLGGQTSGSFRATCSSQTVIMTFARAAPNGWNCQTQDETTPADTLKQTAHAASTCTLTGTTAASDNVVFTATPF